VTASVQLVGVYLFRELDHPGAGHASDCDLRIRQVLAYATGVVAYAFGTCGLGRWPTCRRGRRSPAMALLGILCAAAVARRRT